MRYRIRTNGYHFQVDYFSEGGWHDATPYTYFHSERQAEKWAAGYYGASRQRDREWRTV